VVVVCYVVIMSTLQVSMFYIMNIKYMDFFPNVLHKRHATFLQVATLFSQILSLCVSSFHFDMGLVVILFLQSHPSRMANGCVFIAKHRMQFCLPFLQSNHVLFMCYNLY
jgi:hypothetical protein